jgi:hypothetical protein
MVEVILGVGDEINVYSLGVVVVAGVGGPELTHGDGSDVEKGAGRGNAIEDTDLGGAEAGSGALGR